MYYGILNFYAFLWVIFGSGKNRQFTLQVPRSPSTIPAWVALAAVAVKTSWLKINEFCKQPLLGFSMNPAARARQMHAQFSLLTARAAQMGSV